MLKPLGCAALNIVFVINTSAANVLDCNLQYSIMVMCSYENCRWLLCI